MADDVREIVLEVIYDGHPEFGIPARALTLGEASGIADALAARVAEHDREVAAKAQEWPSVHDVADAHARYHDQPGNLIYENGCGWERCEFWDSVTTLLAERPDPKPAGVDPAWSDPEPWESAISTRTPKSRSRYQHDDFQDYKPRAREEYEIQNGDPK